MSTFGIIVCTVVISLYMSTIIGAVFYFKHEKKHEEDILELHNLFSGIQERQIFLEEEFIKHRRKYH